MKNEKYQAPLNIYISSSYDDAELAQKFLSDYVKGFGITVDKQRNGDELYVTIDGLDEDIDALVSVYTAQYDEFKKDCKAEPSGWVSPVNFEKSKEDESMKSESNIEDLRDQTISWGTMRSEDLIPKFLGVLKTYAKDKYDEYVNENPEVLNIDGLDDETLGWIVDELFDELDKIAPEGTYFGAHPDDGADYGFWSVEESKQHEAKKSEGKSENLDNVSQEVTDFINNDADFQTLCKENHVDKSNIELFLDVPEYVLSIHECSDLVDMFDEMDEIVEYLRNEGLTDSEIKTFLNLDSSIYCPGYGGVHYWEDGSVGKFNYLGLSGLVYPERSDTNCKDLITSTRKYRAFIDRCKKEMADDTLALNALEAIDTLSEEPKSEGKSDKDGKDDKDCKGKGCNGSDEKCGGYKKKENRGKPQEGSSSSNNWVAYYFCKDPQGLEWAVLPHTVSMIGNVNCVNARGGMESIGKEYVLSKCTPVEDVESSEIWKAVCDGEDRKVVAIDRNDAERVLRAENGLEELKSVVAGKDESKKNERGSTQIETYYGFEELIGYADADYLLEDVVDVLSKYYTYEGEGDDIVFDEDQAKDDPEFTIKIEGGDERADYYYENKFYVHLPSKDAAEELAKVLGGELNESKKCEDSKWVIELPSKSSVDKESAVLREKDIPFKVSGTAIFIKPSAEYDDILKRLYGSLMDRSVSVSTSESNKSEDFDMNKAFFQAKKAITDWTKRQGHKTLEWLYTDGRKSPTSYPSGIWDFEWDTGNGMATAELKVSPYETRTNSWNDSMDFGLRVGTEDKPTFYTSVEDVLSALDTLISKTEIKMEAKKSESLTLKQAELKKMAKYGEAEDITTISDEEAKALRKKGIETIGISRGTYGMNGALLRDNEGKKYVITARSSNLFYFV